LVQPAAWPGGCLASRRRECAAVAVVAAAMAAQHCSNTSIAIRTPSQLHLLPPDEE
jgi:hypothetical protein